MEEEEEEGSRTKGVEDPGQKMIPRRTVHVWDTLYESINQNDLSCALSLI